VERWEDFHVLPEFIDTLKTITRLGYEAVIITNQRGVALGRMTLEELEDIHRRLREMLETEHQLKILDILYCPHDGNECECRKPKPGMLLEAAKRYLLDLERSWMIGDSARDVEAGHAAGCRTILVGKAYPAAKPDFSIATMADLSSSIEAILSR
jgi:D-glycero-D-manno-heptose 1,7-bisphosphate phosphatase